MAGDLEAFLRQAAERRLAQKKRAAAKGGAAKPARAARPAPAPEIVEAALVDESVAQHVTRHIQTEAIEQESRQLGERVRAEEAKFESRLESVFDHELGTLSAEATSAAAIGEETPAEKAEARNFLTQLFRNRTRLREAIVLSEILHPPPGLRE